MTDRTFTRVLSVLVAVLFFALAAGVVAAFWKAQTTARTTCERLNQIGVNYTQQWAPVLRAPRAPLRQGATDQERSLYEANTKLRVEFERGFDSFKPIDC